MTTNQLANLKGYTYIEPNHPEITKFIRTFLPAVDYALWKAENNKCEISVKDGLYLVDKFYSLYTLLPDKRTPHGVYAEQFKSSTVTVEYLGVNVEQPRVRLVRISLEGVFSVVVPLTSELDFGCIGVYLQGDPLQGLETLKNLSALVGQTDGDNLLLTLLELKPADSIVWRELCSKNELMNLA